MTHFSSHFSLLCLIAFGTSTLSAQELGPCGTLSARSAWLQAFQQSKQVDQFRSDSMQLTVHAHLVGSDSGLPFDFGLWLGTMGAVEEQFVGTGISFKVGERDSIASSAFDDHATVLEGADGMFTYNHPDGLNLYFVSNPAGNCGYNLPYAGIAVSRQCAGASSTTLAHEIGHGLSLPHPFLGWEGGQTTGGEVPANFGAPAPTTVTYDYTFFQDTLIRDTLIIDTALVELVDRSNCLEAADGFCDTPPDYIANRWTCNADGEGVAQLDPNGERFNSDGSLIMSYSNDACHARFSPDQQAAMKAFARAERSSWVRSTQDTLRVEGPSAAVLADGAAIPLGGTLPYTSVEGASEYFVEVSTRRSFSNKVFRGVLTDTTLEISAPTFEIGEEYYYRIYAFNAQDHRAGFSQVRSFVVDGNVSVSSTRAFAFAFTIGPNPSRPGEPFSVTLDEPASLRLTDFSGRILAEWSSVDGSVQLQAPAAKGVYLLSSTHLRSGQSAVRRLIVAD